MWAGVAGMQAVSQYVQVNWDDWDIEFQLHMHGSFIKRMIENSRETTNCFHL
jgi:hypothetical protein